MSSTAGSVASMPAPRDDNAAAREAFETLARLQPDSPVGPAYLCFTALGRRVPGLDGFEGAFSGRGEGMGKEVDFDPRQQWVGSDRAGHRASARSAARTRRSPSATGRSNYVRTARPRTATWPTSFGTAAGLDEAVARVEEAIRITPVYPPWYMTVLSGRVPRQRGFREVDSRGRARHHDEPR